MTKMQADMAQKDQSMQTSRDSHSALVHCYGQIGISAVAAAVRYQGEAKNQAYAPAATNTDHWTTEEAA
jgi:hypothetical protein